MIHQPGDRIAERYEISYVLGQGSTGATYAATDQQSGERVALKALSLFNAGNWKTLDLFQREATVLQQLNHPAIPQYLNAFDCNQHQDRYFYLVQTLVPGNSLATLVDQNGVFEAGRVRAIAQQLLTVLVYLQSFHPPMLHRDIKPQNVIQSPNGQISLVDFGSVQHVYRNTLTQGSTIVGTFGYMAPEQFRGHADLRTDLYGLGATLLFLLTGVSPANLPQKRLKLCFRDRIDVSAKFADWLERLLEPQPEARFPTAAIALDALQSEHPATISLLGLKASRQRHLPGSRIRMLQDINRLVIIIPGVWWRGLQGLGAGLHHALHLIDAKTKLAKLENNLQLAPDPRELEQREWVDAIGLIQIKIDSQHFYIRWKLGQLGFFVVEPTVNVDWVGISHRHVLGHSLTTCKVVTAQTEHYFGRSLTEQEQNWLVQSINQFLTEIESRTVRN